MQQTQKKLSYVWKLHKNTSNPTRHGNSLFIHRANSNKTFLFAYFPRCVTHRISSRPYSVNKRPPRRQIQCPACPMTLAGVIILSCIRSVCKQLLPVHKLGVRITLNV